MRRITLCRWLPVADCTASIAAMLRTCQVRLYPFNARAVSTMTGEISVYRVGCRAEGELLRSQVSNRETMLAPRALMRMITRVRAPRLNWLSLHGSGQLCQGRARSPAVPSLPLWISALTCSATGSTSGVSQVAMTWPSAPSVMAVLLSATKGSSADRPPTGTALRRRPAAASCAHRLDHLHRPQPRSGSARPGPRAVGQLQRQCPVRRHSGRP